MKQRLGLVSLVVDDYDEALALFVGKLGFGLLEDSFVPEQAKRWVVVSPPGATESRLLLARAVFKDLYGNLWDLVQPISGANPPH